MRNVPDELFTSFINHCPPWHQNSQCLLLTTFDLKPTGAAEGRFGGGLPSPSRSEYLPTRIIHSSRGSVLEVDGKLNEGLVDRASVNEANLIVGI